MKNGLFLISVLILLGSCKQDPEIYLSQDYTKAFKLAPIFNKNIVIDFYTTWCGSCKGYDEFVFTDSSIQAFLKSDFYTLKLDAELPENKDVVKKYKIAAYPTIIIADPSGKEYNRIVGYKDESPQYYIELINRIVQGKENFESYKKDYSNYYDSLELAIGIIHKLFDHEEYHYVPEFVGLINQKSSNEKLRSEADLYLGIALLFDRDSQDPDYIKNKLYTDSSLDDYWKEGIISSLIGHYEKTNIDSFEYYSILLEKDYPNSFYWNRRFAKYLYESNKEVDIASRITKNYAAQNPNDHWTPYLQGYKLVLANEYEEAFNNFDEWMKKYCIPNNISENINKYYKYIDLAVYANYRLDTALEYAELLEKNASSFSNRKLLAKLYFMTDQKEKAIEILKMTIPIIESANEKRQVDELIKKYST
jgi:thiol-disulfide isomerase/thioredoxin